jgi:ATP-dependent Clp protease ATP-binding subunit ClpA
VGYDQGGQLTESIRRRPYQVVLFDEIEKAHPDVIQSLLGLLDNGRMRSSMGDLLDARQCIIIATSNAVTPQQLNRSCIGFQNARSCPDIRELLLNRFPGEFLNRFDHLLAFKLLDASALEKILLLRLREILIRLYREHVVLRFNGRQMLDFLMHRLGPNPSGARGIARLLEKELLQPVSRAMIEKGLSGRLAVHLDDRFYTHGVITITSKE